MISMDSISSLIDTSKNTVAANQASSLQSSLNSISSDSSEDELMQVCKDFESYFVEEVLKEIENNSKLKEIYENWQEDEREEFLAFVTGTKGVKMMYDFISKAILNPEIYEERVEEFLSLLLQQKVKILEVLPNEETGLSDGYSILIMDIVVELENGSIVNLEIQKNGYMFPGERSACYSADLLLRQYRRVRKKNKQEGKKAELHSYMDRYFKNDK